MSCDHEATLSSSADDAWHLLICDKCGVELEMVPHKTMGDLHAAMSALESQISQSQERETVARATADHLRGEVARLQARIVMLESQVEMAYCEGYATGAMEEYREVEGYKPKGVDVRWEEYREKLAQRDAGKGLWVMDPRNPTRPDGDAGVNWARCRECGRSAHSIREIRHRKHCGWRAKGAQKGEDRG